MSNNNYDVFKIYLKVADFQSIILKLPEDEINDKLTILSSQNGSITRSFYEDFVVSNCVANVNQLIYHIRQRLVSPQVLIEIRSELMDCILDINPLLNPNNLIINKNSVVKLKKDMKLKEGEKLLIDNNNWEDDDLENIVKEYTNEFSKYSEENKTEVNTNIKEINDLKYKINKQWWPLLTQYITIKEFKESDTEFILNKKYFYNKHTFHTYIVSICIIDFDSLFAKLDDMGIPFRVSSHQIMEELYELCILVNKYLTFENAQLLLGNNFDTPSSPKRKSFGDKKTNKKSATSKMVFKDVSKNVLLSLESLIKENLIGQDGAVKQVVNSIQRASVGLKDPEKPIGSFLFAGQTGCGKTEFTKVLTEKLMNDKQYRVVIDCSEYSADHEYSKLIGCFVPGSKVLMGTGKLKNIEKIKIGEEVITHKGRNKEVEYVHEYDQDGEMIKYTTVNSNIPVITTNTHEIYCIKSKKCQYMNRQHVICKPTCSKKDCTYKLYENYKPEWIPANELEEKDILLYPRYKPTGEYPKVLDLVNFIKNETRYKYDNDYIWAQKHVKVPRFIEIDKNLVRLAGYYVSEGGVGGGGKALNFTFHSKEISYITEVVKLIRKLFGNDVRIKIEDRSKHHSYRIWVSSKVVCNFMSELFGHNTYVKHLPKWFKDLPNDLIKNFLETAVFGDGCTVIPRRMDYSTVSSDLFSQMELLFRRLGYLTYKQLEPKFKKDNNLKDRYRIFISGNQINKLNDEFNFNIDLLDLKQTNIQRKAWIDEDYVYLQIKWLEKINYTGKVYDLAIKDDTSYIIETSVHNSPQGYVGYEQGGYLTNAIKKHPFSVVVFDEVEKASTKVHELMLQILDGGRLTDGKGETVLFNNTIIIMTSNIGVAEVENIGKTIGFGDVASVTEIKKNKAINKGVKNKFKPEFLNRIDSIVYFKSLTKNDYNKIIKIELNRLNDNLNNNDTEYNKLVLNFNKNLYDFIYKKGINKEFGARPLKRAIAKYVSTPLAQKLLEEQTPTESDIKISNSGGKVVFDIQHRIQEAPFYLSSKYKEANIEEG